MTTAQRLESTLEWWDEDEIPRLRAAVEADQTNVSAQSDLDLGEKHRELAYTRASDAYDRQCDDDYRAQGASWGMSETTFDTMSGGTIVR